MRIIVKLIGPASVLLSVGVAHSADQIVIGQSAPLTGSAASGTAFVRGAPLYIDQVNRSGGVSGRRVELRTLDDGFVPDRAAANARRSLMRGGIGLFGFVNSPSSVAVSKVAAERRVPLTAPANGVSSLRGLSNDAASSLMTAMQSLGTVNLGGYEVTISKDHRDGSRYTAITLARSGGKYAR